MFYGIDYINVEGGYAFRLFQVRPMDQPGVVAISATDLQGIYFSDYLNARMQVFRNRKPLDVLGGSIYLYEWTDGGRCFGLLMLGVSTRAAP